MTRPAPNPPRYAPGYAVVPAAWVGALAELSDSAIRLAVALASFADRWGRCWPGNAALMERAGIADWRTFNGARKKLLARGLQIVERGRRRKLYQVPLYLEPLQTQVGQIGQNPGAPQQSAGLSASVPDSVSVMATGMGGQGVSVAVPDRTCSEQAQEHSQGGDAASSSLRAGAAHPDDWDSDAHWERRSAELEADGSDDRLREFYRQCEAENEKRGAVRV